MAATPQKQRTELNDQRRKVDFDTYDVTVEDLVRRVGSGRIEIAPVYQRQFRWEKSRQSALIESIYLGIPVPPLFMATNVVPDKADQWEVVDGLQRLSSLVNFVGEPAVRLAAGLKEDPLHLTELEKLSSFEDQNFFDLPADLQTSFLDRPVRVIVLNDKSDSQVRFDLFERLNTGGVKLTDQEIRECVYRGPFMDLLTELAGSADFRAVAKFRNSALQDGTPEEWVLRFIAYYERYQKFDHSVKEFLNDFTRDSNDSSAAVLDGWREVFARTFAFLHHVLPNGITRSQKTSPVNLYEGVAVGAALAVMTNQAINTRPVHDLFDSPDLKASTTGATNSRLQVSRRIELCRGYFANR